VKDWDTTKKFWRVAEGNARPWFLVRKRKGMIRVYLKVAYRDSVYAGNALGTGVPDGLLPDRVVRNERI
jgi:hypothetical protein